MLQHEVHQGKMAHIALGWRVIMATEAKPVLNRRRVAGADIGDFLVSDIPFGIETPRLKF
jgi:hypothetical protein